MYLCREFLLKSLTVYHTLPQFNREDYLGSHISGGGNDMFRPFQIIELQ